jgi:CAAX prenyl protease-like protein
MVVGFAVLIIWVIGETPWLQSVAPWLYELYGKWGILPFGEMREVQTEFPYAPGATGWPLTLIRIAGSAFVIGIIEEFFWRGWLYRWMLGKNFLKVDPGTYDRFVFLTVALVFGLEHKEWLAGFGAGLAYAWLYLKTRDIWATALAHALTNFLLGWYVIWADAYYFWS